MDDGAVGAAAGDGVEADLAQLVGGAAEALQAAHRLDLVERAGGGGAVEPGEKAGDGEPVAQMRGARAFDLGGVLDGFQRQRRIRPARDGLGAAERARKPIAGRVGIETHALARRAQRLEPVGKASRLADLGERFEVCAHRRLELFRGDEQLRLAADGHDRKGERHRRVRDVGAADVEHPGDAVAQRQHHRVLLVGLQALLDVGDLVRRRAAGELLRMQRDGVLRRRRARPAPDAIDEIAGGGAQLDAVRLQRGFEALDLGDGVQARVEPDASARAAGAPPATRRQRRARWSMSRRRPARPRRAPAPYSGRRRTASPSSW